MFYNGTSNIATVFVEVRLVDDVRRVGDFVDVLRSTRVVPIRHFITRPSRSNSLIGYAWFVWIIISLHTLPGLCRPSIGCTLWLSKKHDDREVNCSKSLCIDGWVMKSGNVNYSGVSPRLCGPPDKDVFYGPWEKKMMTSMSSLFLYGTVFVLVVFKPSERSTGRGCEDCVVVVPSGSQNVNSWHRRSDVLYDL